jgi:general stress protein YciG
MKEHEKMTREEAGHKGGTARTEKYSKEELSGQAKKAANTVENQHPGFHSEIGKKGSESRAYGHSHEELSEQAKKSAITIEQKHPGFHSEIGQKGGNYYGHEQKYDIDNLEEEEEN